MDSPLHERPLDDDQRTGFVPLKYTPVEPAECLERSRRFYDQMDQRRSVRHFSDRPVSREVIENLIRAASSAPSGAHRQPWTFVAISNPRLKGEIRRAAEGEERENYEHRMSPEWLEALRPLETGWRKPYLEIAPWLVVVLQHTYQLLESGERGKNYYVTESVGIAVGLFITAVHRAGLVCLTHTPSPMGFLAEILGRPANEKPFALLPVGYPAQDCMVPDLRRKSLAEVAVFEEG